MNRVILGLTLLFFANAWAAKPTKVKEDLTPAPVGEAYLLYPDQKTWDEKMKLAKTSAKREVAAKTDIGVSTIEKDFSADFIALRTALIGDERTKAKGVDSIEKLDEIISKYSTNFSKDPEKFFNPEYDKLSPQAKFVALQLRALKPFKSFIFRAKEYIGKNTATRTMIVSMLRAQIAGIQGFFPPANEAPVNHWAIVFDYITMHSPTMAAPIKSDEGMEVFITQLANHYNFIAGDLAKLAEMEPIWWDNKLFMSFANFPNEKDRYTRLGRAELKAFYSGFALSTSSLYSTSAYTLTGLQQTMNSIGAVMGVTTTDAAVRAVTSPLGADGISSYSRHVILNARKDLFKLKPDGQKRMDRAYELLKDAVGAGKEAFLLTKDRPYDEANLFDPRFANGLPRLGGMSFDNAAMLVSPGNQTVSAISQGDPIKVNLYAFYHPAPQHLSDLYPQAWDRGPASYDVKVAAWNNIPDKQRNYRAGMAIRWNYEAYKKIFPDIQKDPKNPQWTAEVPKYARILGQSWGNSVFALPLGSVIF